MSSHVGQVVLAMQMTSWQASAGTPVVELPLPAPIASVLQAHPDQPGWLSFELEPSGETRKWLTVRAASGERFVQEAEDRAAAREGGKIVEMNLAGIVGALRNYHIPGVHLRVISDLANTEARADFVQFVKKYDGRLGEFAWELIRQAKPDLTDPASYPALQELIAPQKAGETSVKPDGP